jgi:hypothetical protein
LKLIGEQHEAIILYDLVDDEYMRAYFLSIPVGLSAKEEKRVHRTKTRTFRCSLS